MTQHSTAETGDPLHGGGVRIARSRGAVSGFLLILLGLWGALISLIGPSFGFGLTPDKSWHWTAARFWLEILPGVATLLGGLLLLLAANRITVSFGAWLAVAGGAWFIVGTDLADLLDIGSPGLVTGDSEGVRAIKFLAYFDGLGAVVLFLAAAAFGRLSVRSVRDVRVAQRREAEAAADAQRERERQEARAREFVAAENARAQAEAEARSSVQRQHEQPDTPRTGDAQPEHQQPEHQQPEYQQPEYQRPGYRQPQYQPPQYQGPEYQQRSAESAHRAPDAAQRPPDDPDSSARR